MSLSPTLLATSNPLDLCSGLPLFPALGQVQFGLETSGSFSTGGHVNLSLEASLFGGICGPSLALSCNVQDATPAGDSFQITADAEQAGLTVGLSASVTVGLNIDVWLFKVSYSATFSEDIMGLAVWAITKALGDDNPFSKATSVFPGALSAWGFFDTASNGFKNSTTVTLDPVISIPVNILPLLGDLGDAFVAMSKVGIDVCAGPSIGIGFPTVITPTALIWDGKTRSGLENDGTNSGVFVPQSVATSTLASDQVQLDFTYAPGLDFEFGIFASISAWGIFSASVAKDWSLEDLLGLSPVAIETVTQTLTNTNGHTSL